MNVRKFIAALGIFIIAASEPVWSQVDPAQFVDPFTGALVYGTPVVSVPGPGGSGYSVNLSYRSGVRPESEASWVGYGWTLDLPVITREKRGLPDDYYDADVEFSHKVPERRVTVIRPWAFAEIFKFDFDPASGGSSNNTKLLGSGGTHLSISYDTDFGFDISIGADVRLSYGPLSGQFTAEHGSGFGMYLRGGSRHNFSWPISFGAAASLSTGNLLSPSRAPALMVAHNATINSTLESGQFTYKLGGIMDPTTEVGVNYMEMRTTFRAKNRPAYGFLYHEHALAKSATDALLDYESDRLLGDESMEAPFSPIPYSTPDHFHVTGRGVSGTFRAYSRLPFDCNPPYSQVNLPVESTKHMEFHTRLALGSAFNIHSRREIVCGPAPIVGGGSREAHSTDVSTNLMRPFVFRYLEDPSDELMSTKHKSPLVGTAELGVSLFEFHPLKRDEPVRANTSVRPLFGNTKILAPTKSNVENTYIIGFEITSENGTTYRYDRPVVVTEERAINHTFRNDPTFRRAGGRVLTLDAGSQSPDELFKETHEQIVKVPYASAFLPTLITTAEYSDDDGDGPDDNETGWTRFTYATLSSAVDVRSPYHGYWFSAGRLENARDDNVAAARVRNELVVIKRIETATHYADFYTNVDDRLDQRRDAYPAQAEVDAARGKAVGGANPQVYLTRILLYKKVPGNGARLVSTTHFAYDYSLVPGNPSTATLEGAQNGKLTLRKVWTEPYKVKSSKISPLELHYQYPTFTTNGPVFGENVPVGALAEKHPELQSAIKNPGIVSQNPSFDANSIDAWGFHGAIGVRPRLTAFNGQAPLPIHYDYRPYVPSASTTHFEAPYNLKRVVMPSGAQLVVQYDRAEYSSIQDSTAMEMRPIMGANPTASEKTQAINRVYALDYSHLSPDDRSILIAEVQRRFVQNQERIYADLTYQVALTTCCPARDEQALMNVPTYLQVTSVSEVTPGVVRLTIGTQEAANKVDVGDQVRECKQLPVSAAFETYRAALRRHYRQDLPSNVLKAAWEIMRSFVETATPPLANDGDNLEVKHYPMLMPTESYFRMPLIGAKSTNIPRVKAVAMISPDGSLQQGDARVVGRTYDYTERSVLGSRSSGVATSEPVRLRHEMGITQVRPELSQDTRDGQAFRSIDIERMELPLGVGLLPSPSIGYARVATTTWNNRPRNSGTSVFTFLTVRDVPTLRIEYSGRQRNHTKLPDIWSILARVSLEEIQTRQGYLVNVRSAHGLPRSVEHYAGKSSGSTGTSGIDAGLTLLSSTRYDYDAPEQAVFIVDTVNRPFSLGHPGATSELIVENKYYRTADIVTQLQGSLSFENAFPLVAVAPAIRNHKRNFSSHVATTLYHWPTRLRRVTTTGDGVRDQSEIVAYDRRTGSACLTTTYDGHHGLVLGTGNAQHNGTVTTYSQKACEHYSEMASKQEAESVVFRNAGTSFAIPGLPFPSVNARHGGIGTGGVAIEVTGRGIRITSTTISDLVSKEEFRNRTASYFARGDTLEVMAGAPPKPRIGYVTSISCSSTNAQVDLDVQWHMPNPSTGVAAQLRIVRSGRTNQVAAGMGSHTFYGLDFGPAKSYARKLQARKNIADVLTDFARVGWGMIGYAYFRPLARYTVGDVSTNEEPWVSGLIYPVASAFAPGCSVNGMPLSKLELRIEAGPWREASSSTPSSRNLVVRYGQRTASSCTDSPIAGYQARMPDWRYWTRFMTADNGDLLVGEYISPSRSVRGPGGFIFGYRDETYVGTTPTGWDATSLVFSVVPVIAGTDYARTRGAAGSIYQPYPRCMNKRQVYRPVASYEAYAETTTDGYTTTTGSSAGVFNNAGVFATAGTWQPPASGGPSGVWRKVGEILEWNDFGLPQLAVGEDEIPMTMLYSRKYLPRAIVMASLPSTTFVDDCEAGTSTASHSGFKAQTLPHTFNVGLNPITHSLLTKISTSYIVRFWIIGNCGPSDLTVTIANGSTNTVSPLEPYRVAKQENMQLYEIPVSGGCTSIKVESGPGNIAAGPCSIDDLLIRPSESHARTFLYDEYDRMVGEVDDTGFLTSIAYDDPGRSTKIYGESVRGRDMIMDMSIQEGSRRRTVEEIRGGIHSSVGPQAMIVHDMIDQALPWIRTHLPRDVGRPSGFGTKGELLRLKASTEEQSIDVLPNGDVRQDATEEQR